MRRPIGLAVWTLFVILASCVLMSVALTSGVATAAMTKLGFSRINLKSSGNVDINAQHVRVVAHDGNVELEHARGTPLRLNSYFLGTPTRTPVNVGIDDGQDVVELRVRGTGNRIDDLAQWTIGGRVVAAIGAKGGLRLGSVTLAAKEANGHDELVATFANGRSAVIASSTAP
jgi:hypothetical protein